MIECPKCGGTGKVTYEEGEEPSVCGRCMGAGQLSAADNRAIDRANAELAQAEDNRLFGRDAGW